MNHKDMMNMGEARKGIQYTVDAKTGKVTATLAGCTYDAVKFIGKRMGGTRSMVDACFDLIYNNPYFQMKHTYTGTAKPSYEDFHTKYNVKFGMAVARMRMLRKYYRDYMEIVNNLREISMALGSTCLDMQEHSAERVSELNLMSYAIGDADAAYSIQEFDGLHLFNIYDAETNKLSHGEYIVERKGFGLPVHKRVDKGYLLGYKVNSHTLARNLSNAAARAGVDTATKAPAAPAADGSADADTLNLRIRVTSVTKTVDNEGNPVFKHETLKSDDAAFADTVNTLRKHGYNVICDSETEAELANNKGVCKGAGRNCSPANNPVASNSCGSSCGSCTSCSGTKPAAKKPVTKKPVTRTTKVEKVATPRKKK